jgi:hypothetical protein
MRSTNKSNRALILFATGLTSNLLRLVISVTIVLLLMVVWARFFNGNL